VREPVLLCPSGMGRGLLDEEVCGSCGGTGRLTPAEWLAAVEEEEDDEAPAS